MSGAGTVVGIIQARMGSTRLPGKVLMDLDGRPLLEQLVGRLRGARRVGKWVIATTTLPADDAIAALADRIGTSCFRGSENDVLDRYYQAARATGADIVLRLTADNPAVDAAFVDECVTELVEGGYDYLDTMTSGTYPYGLSVEVFRMNVLEEAWSLETSEGGREHVTTYIRTAPHLSRHHRACAQNDGDLRWTVDTAEDLEAMRVLFTRFRLGSEQPSHDAIASSLREDSGMNGVSS